ncbi:hypothetical protein Agub_g7073, partial [Astrephomene gubernaculifera]
MNSTTKPVLWYDDSDFKTLRKPRSHINMIYWSQQADCPVTPGVCSQCPRAWQADYDNTRNVTIFFREPWQLDAIHIIQLQNPGVLTVELLPWPAVPIPSLPGLKLIKGTKGNPIWNVTTDTSSCGSTLTIPFGTRAGTSTKVAATGSQSD